MKPRTIKGKKEVKTMRRYIGCFAYLKTIYDRTKRNITK